MLTGGFRLSFRDEIKSICESHSVRLAEELGRVVDGMERAAEERFTAASDAAESELNELLDGIADSIRRIHAAKDPTSALTELVDTASRSCRRATMLLYSGGKAIGFRSSGNSQHPDSSELAGLSIEVASAPAIAHAVESRDTVVTQATHHNLSHALCQRLAYADDDQVSVYPLILRDTVLGILLVDGEQVRPAAIEALVLTAEAWIEALGSRQGDKANGDRNGT